MFLKNKKSIIISILYMFFIFILSSIPVDSKEKLAGLIYLAPIIQNMLHIPLYGFLAFVWMQSFIENKIGFKKVVIYTLIITILYAGFDELHQYFVPGRYASIEDFLFDIIGCLAGALLYVSHFKNRVLAA